MIIRNTLTEAMTVARARGNLTVWLVLSLEGAVYFVFFSRQDLVGLANRNAFLRVGLNAQIRGELPPVDQARQLVWQRIQPVALSAATHSVVDPAGRHAEESMIEHWPQCLVEFLARRNRPPRRADIFISHSPCFQGAASPSPARILGGVQYPVSCEQKLRIFTHTGDRVGIRWSVYYELAFGGRGPLQANFHYGHLRVQRRPNYIYLPG